MDNLEYHPLANLFPLIEGAEFDELVGDIRVHGVQDTIDIFQGKILDGRNRYRAAGTAGVELSSRNFRQFHPEFYGDPLAYVISKNLKRRHLDESQRSMVAARLATMRQGERTDIPVEPSANLPKVDQQTAAKTLSISERALRHARRVQDHGVAELGRAVDRGMLAVSVAEKASRLKPEIQRQIAEQAEAGNESGARNAVKRELRDIRESDLGQKQHDLPVAKFGVIYADPPWRFEVRSENGMDRAADNHYPTMETADILAMKVPDITADDCVLFLWATVPMLPEALATMAAWGFTYKSHCIWNKDRQGNGYWFFNRHELLLVGTKGNIPAPSPGTQPISVIDSPVKDHSRKPIIFRAFIERLFPTLPKIELFARTPADGWHQWGKEAPAPAAEVEEGLDGEEIVTQTKAEKREAKLMEDALADINGPELPAHLGIKEQVDDDLPKGAVVNVPAFLPQRGAA